MLLDLEDNRLLTESHQEYVEAVTGRCDFDGTVLSFARNDKRKRIEPHLNSSQLLKSMVANRLAADDWISRQNLSEELKDWRRFSKILARSVRVI